MLADYLSEVLSLSVRNTKFNEIKLGLIALKNLEADKLTELETKVIFLSPKLYYRLLMI